MVRAALTDVLSAAQQERRELLAADPALVDPRKYLGAARTATAREVERLVRLLAD